MAKSILDATAKDAAAIEVRSLGARLEGLAGKGVAALTQRDLESVARHTARLADLIDAIDEKPLRRRRRAVARG